VLAFLRVWACWVGQACRPGSGSAMLLGNSFSAARADLAALHVTVMRTVATNAAVEKEENKGGKKVLLPRKTPRNEKPPLKETSPDDSRRARGMSKGEVDPVQLDKAFTAFADTLLQKKGRVRFYRINDGFRQMFPQFDSEEKLSNQTLGRRVQMWYESRFGEPIGKSGRGAYVGLTMLNPQYVSVNMQKIRAVQAELNEENAKMMASMGIPVRKGAGGEQGPRSETPRARTRKQKAAPAKDNAAPVGEPGGRERVNQRLGSVGAPGGLDRVNQRLGSMSPGLSSSLPTSRLQSEFCMVSMLGH
jgi:hypothetical protein